MRLSVLSQTSGPEYAKANRFGMVLAFASGSLHGTDEFHGMQANHGARRIHGFCENHGDDGIATDVKQTSVA